MMLKHPTVRSSHRKGITTTLILIGVVASTLIGAAIYYLTTKKKAGPSISPITSIVTQGEFVSQVLDQGEVQSSDNVEIRCEVSSRNGSVSVIEVVPEGTAVSEGDFLVQLDSTSFEKELETQKIAVANAETAVIQAEADLNVAIESKKEYEQGTFKQTMLEIENEIADAKSAIKTAEQEKEQSEAVLLHSTKLAQKGFITNQQLEGDRFAVERADIALQRAKNSLELADRKKWVLAEITKQKEMFQYDSDIKAARVKLTNQQEALKVEQSQLAEIEEMIKNCCVVVPEGVSGQVVYAKESNRRGEDWVLEEGTTVRERQVLIRLPNPNKMQVKALINEQSITAIEEGMPATIRVDALTGVILKGVVTKVNQYAESSGWMSSSIRKYAVMVRIIDPPSSLKPGMNASVNIQTMYEKDAIMAPIQVVYAVGDEKFCMIKEGEDNYDTRKIEIAADNSQMVLITDGVKPGDELVMNPGAYKDRMELPEIKLDQKIDVPEEEIAKAKAKAKAQDADGPGNSRGQGGSNGGGGGAFSVDMIVDRTMDKYDTNGDGQIDKDEQKSFDERASRMSDADSNGDGNLSRDEIKKSMEAMMKRMRERMNGGGGGPGGPGGGGRGGPR